MRKKWHKFDAACILCILAIGIIGLLLPKSGRFVLLDEAVDDIFLWGVVVYLVVKVRKARSNIRTGWYLYLVCGMLACFALWESACLLSDAVRGPKTVVLQDVSFSQYQGVKGFSTRRYYLKGSDASGKKYSIEISESECRSIGNVENVTVTCYENTGRLYRIGNID